MAYLKKKYLLKIPIGVVLIWYLFFSLPVKLFNAPTSTVLFDKENHLLAAKLADDEQWRFPTIDSVPKKFEQCLLQFEDAYFRYHPGFNPISISKALFTNLKQKRIARGGSTITMQTLRLARNKKSRTIYQKIVELILATRLELRYSKDKILQLYTSNTPYGGNIVGLEAASWRYYGRNPHQLSWAESAMLAVLPNAPSLIHPGKNRDRLKKKRDRLLDKLLVEEIIDSTTCYLAKQEPIPSKPQPLPKKTQHLLQHAIKSGYKGQQLNTTIDESLQIRTLEILKNHKPFLESNHIYNASCLVLDIDTGNVLAYVGNTPKSKKQRGQDVDIIQSSRSTGSILKPFLYAASLQEGNILPNTLLPDIPTYIAGYTPKNFSKTYDGAVPAKEALSRSLNVPAVRMLRDYRYERFHDLIRRLGLSTISKPADHYGLSLILGGAEANLWELSGIYASLARTLKKTSTEGRKLMHPPKFIRADNHQENYTSLLDDSSIYLMLEAMLDVNRPEQEEGWEHFNYPQNIAWKTGTSFGNRDAWSIGVSHNYVVGVWVGNADGEGRSELTGTKSASPIMFDIFRQLNTNTWFSPPFNDLFEIETCKHSGYKAGQYCPEKLTILGNENGIKVATCPYHKLTHLSLDRKYQVNSTCTEPYEMIHEPWFVLPPVMEWYYKRKHSGYLDLPPLQSNCSQDGTDIMEVIYPKNFSKLFIPKELNGKLGKLIFKIAHRDPKTTLYWHIDNEFIGETINFHELSLQPQIGKHKLTLVDKNGIRLEKYFEILE